MLHPVFLLVNSFLDGLPVQVNYRGIQYTNGETFTITLQQYETFLAQSRGDMTGAKVLANKPVSYLPFIKQ